MPSARSTSGDGAGPGVLPLPLPLPRQQQRATHSNVAPTRRHHSPAQVHQAALKITQRLLGCL